MLNSGTVLWPLWRSPMGGNVALVAVLLVWLAGTKRDVFVL
jgi:hypothetical protein